MLWCSAIFPSVQSMMVGKAWVVTIGYTPLFMSSCGNLTYSNTAHTTHRLQTDYTVSSDWFQTESRYNRTPNPLPTHFHCVCLTCCGPSTTHLIFNLCQWELLMSRPREAPVRRWRCTVCLPTHKALLHHCTQFDWSLLYWTAPALYRQLSLLSVHTQSWGGHLIVGVSFLYSAEKKALKSLSLY